MGEGCAIKILKSILKFIAIAFMVSLFSFFTSYRITDSIIKNSTYEKNEYNHIKEKINAVIEQEKRANRK
ncbi:hypothetical protein SAMN02745945_02926 [Peptoclostridium litorale DSM 5388]|uniref:Uncharacterized protein n=1 Tax=Peptoclostridium litorale DSM 5388 TaxID=1121324 RepID=A0A069RBR3_PEPLI|nr:hypothetical protein [Peptoclostridium litorale]KDR94486.1 hypothetical protein CLIT_17c00130 [Peptoclostridium litorale DSM 5388]SIO35875.1 hypothetical protein SAMN02745945_02926 [Peptoclostridium litorale DSM 5388]